MRSGRRPSPEGTRLLFAVTISPMICPVDGRLQLCGTARYMRIVRTPMCVSQFYPIYHSSGRENCKD